MKGILAAGTEADPPPEPTGDAGAAAHLHGPSQLFANVVALPTPNIQPAADDATTSVDHGTDAHAGLGDRADAVLAVPTPTAAGTDSEEAS